MIACALLSACSAATSGSEPDAHAEQSAALVTGPSFTQQKTVLGFEAPTAWSVSAGTRTASGDASRGAKAVALAGADQAVLTSPPIQKLNGVSAKLLLDVKLPASVPWGQVQLYVDSPQSGIHHQWVGLATLQGLSGGQYHTLSFAVSPTLQALLSQAQNVVFKVEVNRPRPTPTAATLVDRLRFELPAGIPDCAENSAIFINVERGPAFSEALLEKVQCRLYDMYPVLADRFDRQAPTSLRLLLETHGVAGAGGNLIGFNVAHFTENPNDLDAFVHEAMHLMQSRYLPGVPGWFIEGGADWVRNEYRTPGTPWAVAPEWAPGMHYRTGEVVSFFNWIDAHYRVGQTPLVEALHFILLERTYTDAMWVELTGVDLDALWLEYSGDQAPVGVPVGQGVSFFQDPDYVRLGSTLPVGEYDATRLGSYGVVNDDVSSIKVPAGFAVTAFEHGDFSGAQHTFTADSPQLSVLNNQISSLIVTEL
ncbi:MAG: secretory protein [Polyangiaceae bacterium]|jgi:hypothetical protein|nr:secretory protein [Polyangiaceae bacterium]